MKNKKYPKYKKKNYRNLLLLGCALLMTAVAFVLLEKTGVTNFYENSKSPINEDGLQPETDINYAPPTDEEAMAGDKRKESIVNNQNNTDKPATANVVIVDASQYNQEIEVRAFISNIIENGTCKITFSQGTAEITKVVEAFADASTTPCVNLVVPRNEFTTSGEWNVTVSYESDELTGTATTVLTIE